MFSPLRKIKSPTSRFFAAIAFACCLSMVVPAVAAEKKKSEKKSAKSKTTAAQKPATRAKPTRTARPTRPKPKTQTVPRKPVTRAQLIQTARPIQRKPQTQTVARKSVARSQQTQAATRARTTPWAALLPAPKSKPTGTAASKIDHLAKPIPQPRMEHPVKLPQPGGRFDKKKPENPTPQPRRPVDDPQPKIDPPGPNPHPRGGFEDDPKPRGRRPKPPRGDPPPERWRERKEDRFERRPPPADCEPLIAGYVEYEICDGCGYYACRCDFFDVTYYEDDYLEAYPIRSIAPAANPEVLNFALTSGAVVLNALFIADQNRNTPAAFFGVAFGAGSVLLGLSGRTEHSGPAVLLGVASIIAAYVNLQISDPTSEPFGDPHYATSAGTAAGLTLSF